MYLKYIYSLDNNVHQNIFNFIALSSISDKLFYMA